jgi:hypothetical protein
MRRHLLFLGLLASSEPSVTNASVASAAFYGQRSRTREAINPRPRWNYFPESLSRGSVRRSRGLETKDRSGGDGRIRRSSMSGAWRLASQRTSYSSRSRRRRGPSRTSGRGRQPISASQVTAYLAPGHSLSSTSWLYTVRDGGKNYRVFEFCCWEYPDDISRNNYINEASVRHTFETFRFETFRKVRRRQRAKWNSKKSCRS